MQKDQFGIMQWLPRVLGCFLIVGWTMPTTGSKDIFPILNSKSLVAAGSLMAEFNKSTLQHVSPKAVADAVKVPSFAEQLEKASPLVKLLLVQKLLDFAGGRNDFVKYVPDPLIPYVPKYELAFGRKFDIENLNHKPWTSEQAALFFDDLIQTGVDFNRMSTYVLSGFTCTVVNSLSAERLQKLAKAMKQKNVPLTEDQLSCLEKSLTQYGIKNFQDYPKDLFLFFNPAAALNGSCKDYITQLGKANIDILKEDSPQRKLLLTAALVCLRIQGQQISKENADILGHLVCDLGPNYITTSGKNLLKQLNHCQCHPFTPDQITAIRAVLSSGNIPFGLPSKWTPSSLDALRGLIQLFDHNIMKEIPKDILIPWLKNFIRTTKLTREKLVGIIESLHQSNRRTRASEECPADKTITEKVAYGTLMPVDYTPAELRACLNSVILEKYLPALSEQSFTSEQAAIAKAKLDELFPSGYPDQILRNLGSFILAMTADDVKKWTITSVDTFAALLTAQPPDETASQIIKKYTDSTNFLGIFSVFAIGTRYICILDEKQLSYISEDSIKLSISLDPSRCSQNTKNFLYPKAKYSFAGQQSNPADYYNLMKPYLGGAPSEDLKGLQSGNINMDIDTFLNLRKSSLLRLTPSDVKGLLGINLKELKNHENNTLIKEWIPKQRQADLDQLGIGLSGGIPDKPSPPSASINPAVNSGCHALRVFHAFLLALPLLLLLLNFFLL